MCSPILLSFDNQIFPARRLGLSLGLNLNLSLSLHLSLRLRLSFSLGYLLFHHKTVPCEHRAQFFLPINVLLHLISVLLKALLDILDAKFRRLQIVTGLSDNVKLVHSIVTFEKAFQFGHTSLHLG